MRAHSRVVDLHGRTSDVIVSTTGNNFLTLGTGES